MAIDFDSASSEYIQATGYKGILGTNPRSISAWIKVAGGGAIVSWGTNAGGKKWVLRTAGAAIRLGINGGNVVGTAVVNDGAWHHVAVTWENDGTPNVTDALLYVDGLPDAISSSGSRTVATTSGDDVKIGIAHDDAIPFGGLIDDVRIYDRALAAAEIAALYAQRGADGIVYGLVSRWRMDEASPGTVVSGAGVVKDDVSGNSGTPNATPVYAESELSWKRVA